MWLRPAAVLYSLDNTDFCSSSQLYSKRISCKNRDFIRYRAAFNSILLHLTISYGQFPADHPFSIDYMPFRERVLHDSKGPPLYRRCSKNSACHVWQVAILASLHRSGVDSYPQQTTDSTPKNRLTSIPLIDLFHTC